MGCNTSSEKGVHSSHDDDAVDDNKESKVKEHDYKAELTEEVQKAAVKIQAAFRGHKTRTSMKQASTKAATSNSNPDEPTKEELEAEFSPDDKDLCNAVSKIQTSFRGKAVARKQAENAAAAAAEAARIKEEEEIAEINLADPELNKAATKIQASFRGHKVRKEN